MKAKLARQFNGQYSLFRFDPICTQVLGSGHEDFYVLPGDPLGYRNLCELGVQLLLGADPGMDRLSEPMDVEAFLIPAANMTAQLREIIKQAQRGEVKTNGIYDQDQRTGD